MTRRLSLAATSCLILAALAIAQRPPRPRLHRVISKGELNVVPATQAPSMPNEVTIEIDGDERVVRSNGIPDHKTGKFPNRGNPNTISKQKHEYRIPANPKIADRVTPMRGEFGVAINGVPFDPGAGEFYDGEAGWQYEPLSGAIALGIDVSHAHVQPTGKYHYHGLPTGLLDAVELSPSAHSPLIGWAADGFPIYAVYGYADAKSMDSAIVGLKSSYRLRKGARPGGDAPGGTYDGTFVRDYEYVAGSGDLDECNGRFTVTPDYPEGTYAYFLTEDWPVVPRNYRGTPSDDFRHHGGGPGGRHEAAQERRPAGRRDRHGHVLPPFLRESLELSDQQEQQLDELQKTVDDRLNEILTDPQKELLESAQPPTSRNRSAAPRQLLGNDRRPPAGGPGRRDRNRPEGP